MNDFEQLDKRIKALSPLSRIALCAGWLDRLLPIYTNYWSGDHSEAFASCANQSWRHIGGDAEARRHIEALVDEIESRVDLYNEQGIGILADVTTVALRLAQSIQSNANHDAIVAIQRAMGNAQFCARTVDAVGKREGSSFGAEDEELAWRDRSLAALEGSRAPLSRKDMASLGSMPPRWWPAYQKGRFHLL